MNKKVLRMTRIALFTCIICIFGQISITLPSLVPITMQTLAIYIIALTLTPIDSFITTSLYVILGAIGLPVFSMFTGGISSLLGPAGGFIFSFPLMALLISLINKYNDNLFYRIISLVIGTSVCYLIGLLWFMLVTESNLYNALIICVIPFIIGDLLKIFLSLFISKALKKRLNFEK